MVIENKFIEENINRLLIKEFLRKEISGAGFGGMDIQRTPMGTRITMIVERPGLVIGRGGANISRLTEEIKERFGVDNPQIEIQEAGSNAALNAQIMAEKLAEALVRGWHFRRAGHSTVRRIMDAGAKGCQVILSGKLTGARHRTEKFTEGHVKYCGETARETMDEGYAVAKKKAGIIGVRVRIMRPDAKLPDEIKITAVPKEKSTAEKPEKKQKKVEEKPEVEEPTVEKTPAKVTDIKGVGSSTAKELEKKGITSLEDLQDLSVDDLAEIKGIGKKTAKEIKEQLKKLAKEEA
ncbi:MAG: 30S ribosomal protein S3 [Thermoplasmata archaeon]|nr:MAG: 30S ribosomal protein S3 [Thermoplasmata archaeon]RLF26935.1 MAG: 30S ribosomal protein S3 [Thermoplasmata archaeon]